MNALYTKRLRRVLDYFKYELAKQKTADHRIYALLEPFQVERLDTGIVFILEFKPLDFLIDEAGMTSQLVYYMICDSLPAKCFHATDPLCRCIVTIKLTVSPHQQIPIGEKIKITIVITKINEKNVHAEIKLRGTMTNSLLCSASVIYAILEKHKYDIPFVEDELIA
jgi:acyl-CoA thioesterase FadM